MKKFYRILTRFAVYLTAVLLVLWLLLQTPMVQQWATRLAESRLETILGTRVQVGAVRVGLLNRFSLKNLCVYDKQGDTLVAVQKLKLAVTDWFPWHDTTVIRYVSLSGVRVLLQRSDTLWNYAFLDSLLAGNGTDTSRAKPLKLALEFAELRNVHVAQQDFWRGKYLYGGVSYLQAKGEVFDPVGKLIRLSALQLHEPYYHEIRSRGRWQKADSIAFWRRIDSLDALPRPPRMANPNPFVLQVQKVHITGGNLRFFNRRKKPSLPGVFDERDIIITQIAGDLSGVELKGDTIRAHARLQARERSGFALRRVETDFTMHPQLMEFANLDLQTPNSRLGPYYAMRYNDIADMEYFIDRVKITSSMRNARVSVADIAVFAPELKGINQTGVLTATAAGTVHDFSVQNVDLRAGNSRVTGTYAMKGLIDIEKTIIDFTTAGSAIDIRDLEPWAAELRELRQTPVANLGIIGFAGSFRGTPFDFFVKGGFTTLAGNIAADLALKLEGENKGYTGNITRANLNGGLLFGVPRLGSLQLAGKVQSAGFGMDNDVVFDGDIAEISYAGYTYHNLKSHAVFSNNLLIASLEVDDPNLAGSITTSLNFSEKKQRYIARGNIAHSNFYNLRLFGDTLLFRGDVDLDFEGNKVDEFLGYARFYNAAISNGRRRLSFDSLLLESAIDAGGTKRLSLRTNEASGFVEGKFELSKLPQSFGLFLSGYYPSLIKAPEGDVPGQDFSFEVTTGEVEPFLQLFDRSLGGGNNAKLVGSLNTETRQLLLSADIPAFRYGNLTMTEVDLQGSGSARELTVYGSVANLQLNEKIAFPNTVLRIATLSDSTRLTINTTNAAPLGNASISADFFSQPEGFSLRFNESSFFANKKKWTVAPNSGFRLKRNLLFSDGFVLLQDNQRLEAITHPHDEGDWNDIQLRLTEVSMGDWLPYFFSDPRLEGQVTGEMVISDPLRNPQVQTGLQVNRFYFNSDSIGNVAIRGTYDHRTALINALLKSDNPAHNFEASVGIDLAKGAALPMNSTITFRNERLTVLREYLTDILADIDGFASGTLRVAGPLEKPALLGALQVRNATLLVDYTQCRYRVDTGTVYFGDNYLDFGALQVQDNKGRKGRLEGKMYHRFFDSLSFALRMRTDGMQVLNTVSKDNDLFYGNVTGRAAFDLTGPLNNLQMRITGAPTDSSWIAITNEESRTSGEADYIVFREYASQETLPADTNSLNLHILLELTANPLCRVDVVLDELTGDIISATGSGNLTIRSGTVDPTEIRGRYVVQNGSYNYTFQSFIRKPFILDGDGNNFLEWTGDPYEANMNVKATYIARDISLRDLVSNENNALMLDQNARNYKGDVWVNAAITGNLSRPDIKFSIEFPPGSVMRNNITANDLLRRISEDASENLRQVTYLIVFRSFAPYRQGAGARNPGADLAVNTISELVSREMEKILTGVLQDLTRDKSLSVDLSTNFYNSSQTLGNVSAFNQYDRVNFNFNLNRTFFNSRVKVNLGSDFDLNVRNTTATGFQFLPDVSVEFILTSNRRLRAIIFKRDNLDISGRRNRAGASISYRREFDKLFGRRDEEALFFIRKE